MKRYLLLVLCVLCIFNAVGSKGNVIKHDLALSYDAETIAYSVYGSGDTTLVFIHGWSSDSRYWMKQLAPFGKDYKIITIDLAGHGNSSSNRKDYTINSFAKDIRAVIEREDLNNVILIGHSMGGSIVATAVQYIPNRVKGIIGIDTFHDVSSKRPQKAIDALLTPFSANYKKTMGVFVARLFSEKTNEGLKRWISHDMTSAPKSVAVSAISHFMQQFITGDSASVFKDITIPVISINAKQRPTNETGNKETIKNYRLVYIAETGHFPMLEKPQEFNMLLDKAIHDIEK
ncbi:MAG: alpha/beta hydrolase [Paraglaciecola sp.]|uniref:alpha/beta fold hydrolase n=1 Tax=Paraglaciecola sp. TaxID=1920173 RepID=UPI003299CD4A